MNASIDAARAAVAAIGALLFERHLLDLAGGNISVRAGDVICISPRYTGTTQHWHLTPERVLVVSPEGDRIDGDGELSRESKVHLRLHQDHAHDGTAVIHAHARHVLVFAAARREIPPVLEATRKFGTIPVIEYAPAHSAELSESIVAAIAANAERIRMQAAAVIAPYHGLFCIGKTLDAAADAVERIDTNAYCLLMAGQIGASMMLEDERARMESEIGAFTSRSSDAR